MSKPKQDEFEKAIKGKTPEVAIAILITMLRENVKRQNELKEEIEALQTKVGI